MGSIKQCAICGAQGQAGVDIMGQYICPFCQTLLDDPKTRERSEQEKGALTANR